MAKQVEQRARRGTPRDMSVPHETRWSPENRVRSALRTLAQADPKVVERVRGELAGR